MYSDTSTLWRDISRRCLNRGYLTAARRYELYFRVVKTIFYEQTQRVSKLLFQTRENDKKKKQKKNGNDVIDIFTSEIME